MLMLGGMIWWVGCPGNLNLSSSSVEQMTFLKYIACEHNQHINGPNLDLCLRCSLYSNHTKLLMLWENHNTEMKLRMHIKICHGPEGKRTADFIDKDDYKLKWHHDLIIVFKVHVIFVIVNFIIL